MVAEESSGVRARRAEGGHLDAHFTVALEGWGSGRSLPSISEVGMREQGWRNFLAAEDVGDWVVLHGGATAVFVVSSLADAARLAAAVSRVRGIEGTGVLITIADDQLTVRLTRGIERLEPRHVGLARA